MFEVNNPGPLSALDVKASELAQATGNSMPISAENDLEASAALGKPLPTDNPVLNALPTSVKAEVLSELQQIAAVASSDLKGNTALQSFAGALVQHAGAAATSGGSAMGSSGASAATTGSATNSEATGSSMAMSGSGSGSGSGSMPASTGATATSNKGSSTGSATAGSATASHSNVAVREAASRYGLGAFVGGVLAAGLYL